MRLELGGRVPEITVTDQPLEVTREASTTVDTTGAAASSARWRDVSIMLAFSSCALGIGLIPILYAPANQDWTLANTAISVLDRLAGGLLAGYFALQVSSKK